MAGSSSEIYEFGDFRLDARGRILHRHGEEVAITPRVMDTLLYLVKHHGRLIEKDELMAHIWPDAVVEENNLNQNISTLRRLLGETRGVNRFIVTVPGRGYRFADNVKGKAVTQTLGEDAPQTIAVLPFVNMSADPDNVYFCEGLAEELLNALSRVEGIKVAARTSAFSFGGKNAHVSEIGAALGVKTVLEGSVRRSGGRLRITAQLANASDGYQLWSERYDRELRDIFDVQDEITLAVVAALKIKLLGKEKVAALKRYTQDTEAYQLYLKGRYFWFKSSPAEFRKSREYFERAIEADPSYALGYFGLASYYGFGLSWGLLAPDSDWALMEAHTLKALELDDTLAEAHHGLAALHWVYHRDWSRADEAFRQAIALNPNIGAIHSHYSIFLSVIGRFDEAIAEGKLALELDPLSVRLHRNQAANFYVARRYEEAMRQYLEALDLEPAEPSLHEELGDVYEQLGRRSEAIGEWLKATASDAELAGLLSKAQIESDFVGAVHALATTRLKRLQTRMARGEYVPAVFVARAYVRLGDLDQAFSWLEKASHERNAHSLRLNTDPFYDNLRRDQRFGSILTSMNFEPGR